jgi:hypothetical protein
MHWNGTSWQTTISSAASVLYGVAGTGRDNVWAAGNGEVNADAAPTGTFVPEILNWNGSAWTVSFDNNDVADATSLPIGVWVASSGEVWVATTGAPLQYTGLSWQPMAVSGAPEGPTAFNGTGPNDLWGTFGSAMVHWTGASWEPSYAVAGIGSAGAQPVTLTSVWASSTTDVWAVGAGGALVHFDGTSWSSVSLMPELRSTWAIAPDDAWAVGADGAAWHWNGAWSPTDTGTTAAITAVWGAASDDVWSLASDSTVRRWGGASWATQSITTSDPLAAIGGTGSSNVWVSNAPNNLTDGGSGGPSNAGEMFHWEGSGWTSSAVPLGEGTASWIQAIWANSASDVWAVGYQAKPNPFAGSTALVTHWNGTDWSIQDTQLATATTVATEYTYVWASSASDVWVAGSAAGTRQGGTPTPVTAAVAHWNGSAWTDETLGGTLATLVGAGALWGSGPSDAWLAGHLSGSLEASFLHWNGSAWSTSAILPDAWSYVNAMTGTGPNDLWVVGSGGMILHHL